MLLTKFSISFVCCRFCFFFRLYREKLSCAFFPKTQTCKNNKQGIILKLHLKNYYSVYFSYNESQVILKKKEKLNLDNFLVENQFSTIFLHLVASESSIFNPLLLTKISLSFSNPSLAFTIRFSKLALSLFMLKNISLVGCPG